MSGSLLPGGGSVGNGVLTYLLLLVGWGVWRFMYMWLYRLMVYIIHKMDSGLKRFLQIKCNANDVSIQEQEFVLLGD